MWCRHMWVGSALLVAAMVATAAGQGRTREEQQRYGQDAAWSERQYQPQSERGAADASWERPSDRMRSVPQRDHSRAGYGYRPEFRKASDLMDARIVDVRGRSAGTIENLALDADHGVVAYAIVDRSGISGAEQDRVAIPFTVLSASAGRDRIRMQTDETILNYVPGIPRDAADRLSNPRWARELHMQFNVEPYWLSTGQGQDRFRDEGLMREQEIYGYGDPDWDDQATREREEQREYPQRQQYSREWRETGPSLWERDIRGESERGRMLRGAPIQPQWRTSGPDQPGRIILASDVLNEDIEGASREKIGELEDLMVDMNTAGIGYAVLSSDELAGDELSAVPWTLVRTRGERDRPTLTVDMTRRELAEAPVFDKDQWPDMSSPRWNEYVYGYYGVEPSWTYYGYMGAPDQRERSRQSTPRYEQD